jgi:hypothetical protein
MGLLIKTQMEVPKPTGQPIVFNNVRENSLSKAKPYLDSYLVKIKPSLFATVTTGRERNCFKKFFILFCIIIYLLRASHH